MPDPPELDVVVVGAGLAGLTAAHRLHENGADVLVLEARDRVGGRTMNQGVAGAQVVEMGGQWVGPTQDRVLALMSELGLETFPTRTEGKNVIQVGGKLRRYRGTIPKLSPLALYDLARVRAKLARAVNKVDAAKPWDAKGAAKLDSITFADWIFKRTRSKRARELVALSCKTVFGAEPSEFSALHAFAYFRSGGGFEKLLDVEGGAQQDRVVGGSALIAERLRSRLDDRVLLSRPVRAIAADESGVTAITERGAYSARKAIVAVPPQLLAAIDFEPDLPAGLASLAEGTTGGNLIKVCATYPEPFWRADGLSGEGVSTTGPVTITFDNTPPSDAPGALVGFVGGSDAPGYAKLNPGQRRKAALASFGGLFGPKALEPNAFYERDWFADEWSRGAPVANPAMGALTDVAEGFGKPHGSIHFAGSEWADRWRGYMDGAVRSGEEAASAVLAGPG